MSKRKIPMIVPKSLVPHLSLSPDEFEVLELDDEEFKKLRIKYGCPEESLK